MNPSSAIALASNRLGHSAFVCALAGTDFAVVAVMAASAAERRKIAFRQHLNIPSLAASAQAGVCPLPESLNKAYVWSIWKTMQNRTTQARLDVRCCTFRTSRDVRVES